LGRMAFTNYLAQSVIFSAIFYSYGFGLFGRLGASAALILGVAVYSAQVIFSGWWLKRYHFGPIEWLWRTLMYGRLQPMRRSTTPALSSGCIRCGPGASPHRRGVGSSLPGFASPSGGPRFRY